MFDYLTELMLKEYFTIDVTVGSYVADKKALFACLSRVFLLPQERADALFALVCHDEVAALATEKDYHRYRRVMQFCEMNSLDRTTDPAIDELVDLKGTAITAATRFGILQDTAASKIAACGYLTYEADCGNVLALHVLGILQAEGIVFSKNTKAAVSNLRRAANWNNEEGLLAAIYYDGARRAKHLARLQARLTRTTRQDDSFDAVKAAYGAGGRAPKEFSLLEKAFNRGILKRELYDGGYARILFSETLGIRDKESLLFSPNKELLAQAADLPLKLGLDSAPMCDVNALTEMRPRRPEELKQLERGLGNIDLRGGASYRPICLVSDCKYLLERYASALTACFEDAHIERVEVADLAGYDLEPTASNIFVRSCDEDVFNAYYFFFRGDIGENVLDVVKNFLQSEKRGKFRLHHPAITLNLNAILPVCFADRENANYLRPFCDIVKIEPATRQEKGEIAADILEAKRAEYGVEELTMQESVAQKISGYPVDEIERILDAAVRDNRLGKLILTDEIMRPYFKSAAAKRNTYGFGGGFNEEDRK